MSSEALKWFNKVSNCTETAAQFVVLHVMCCQDPAYKSGTFFKPNLSAVPRKSAVTRQTASQMLCTLERIGLIERRAPKKSRTKSSIRLCLEKDFEDILENNPSDHDVNLSRQLGVARGYSKLSSEQTETVTSDDTTHKQEQGSGIAISKPKPDPCSASTLRHGNRAKDLEIKFTEISDEQHAKNLSYFTSRPRKAI